MMVTPLLKFATPVMERQTHPGVGAVIISTPQNEKANNVMWHCTTVKSLELQFRDPAMFPRLSTVNTDHKVRNLKI